MFQGKDCPICKISSEDVKVLEDVQKSIFNCARCGQFMLAVEAFILFEKEIDDPKLSAWIRDHKENRIHAPEINPTNAKTILKNLPSYTPTEKQTILLKRIERKTKYPSFKVLLSPIYDIPLSWAENSDEFIYYTKALEERGLIKINEEDISGSDFPFEVSILPQGWEYLEKYSKEPLFIDQAFVAMSFSERLLTEWEDGIKPAVKKAGYRPYRVDRESHVDRIDAKIIAEIRNSRFVIADVTEQKQGVYYEAGFAQGLDRPVLWSVNEDDLKNVHFDTRQFNHIIWKTPEDLKEKLYDLICAVIGKNTRTDFT